jgi:hypothetical protein
VIRTYEFAPKVSALVAAGKVRLSKDAHERSRTAPLGSALDFRIEKLSDPLAAASLAGICLGAWEPVRSEMRIDEIVAYEISRAARDKPVGPSDRDKRRAFYASRAWLLWARGG